jgi:2-polyprenyl-6-methoxyphenol hydroxylase-like FAD-dependent oxidoreductase
MTIKRLQDCAVLIAGAGPVGLALAIELGMRGVDCLLVEKRDGAVTVPKMSAVSARNMEFCRRWGIAERVRTAVWAESHSLDFVYLTTLTGRELARQKIGSYVTRGDLPYTPEGGCHCPQIYFDPILTGRARALPGVRIVYETALESFVDTADGVAATLLDTRSGERCAVHAQYLVGCDGAGGAVRAALGIGLGGKGVVADSVNIFFRSPGLSGLHDKGWARFYRAIDATGCWSELIAIDGRELWRLTVFDERRTPGEPEDYLGRVVGRDFPYEILSAAPWERRDAVANSYGAGRVYIAGDAAHQCSPTGGLGMHTGIEEAVNIAWKLQAMVEGWGGPNLLASYEAERLPIAVRNVDMATRAFRQIAGIPGGDALGDDGPEGSAQRAALDEAMRNLRRYSVSEIDKAQYCYEGSPVCVPDGTPPAPADDGSGYVPSARPGTRAPHAWIEPGRSTLDLFGDGFVLLDFGGPGDGAALAGAMAERGVPCRTERIDDPRICAAYAARFALVRPDGHVAWRGDAMPASPAGVADRVRGALAS